MRKYTTALLVFVLFIILLGFNATSANAYDSGCNGISAYSVTTGQACSNENSQDNSSSDLAQFNTLFKSNFAIGLKSSDVKPLQQFLKDQGYYFGKIDGKYGKISARAVSDFRDDNNLVPVVNSATPSPTIAPIPVISNNVAPSMPAYVTPTPSITIPTQTYPSGCISNTLYSTTTGQACYGSTSSAPTVVANANPAIILLGQPSTISWSSTGANLSCNISPSNGLVSASGNEVVYPTSSTNYSVNCTTPSGQSASGFALVTVTTPAYMPGCSSTSGWSSTTGQSCSYLPGCSSAQGWSSVTGNACDGSTPPPTYPAGCSSTSGYSSTTGLACNGSGTTNPSFLPGCSSTSGYSSINGQSCAYLPGCSSASGYSSTSGQSCSGN